MAESMQEFLYKAIHVIPSLSSIERLPSIKLSHSKQTIYLEITQQVENCQPLLLQRWRFCISLKRIHRKVPLSRQEEEKILQSLQNSACKIAHSKVSSLTMQVYFQPNGLSQFDPDAEIVDSDVIAKYETVDMNCKVSVEYMPVLIKPKLMQAQLGRRPRLSSFDTEQATQIRDKNTPGQIDIDSFIRNQKHSLIDSEGLLDQVGFNLISSQIVSQRESGSDYEGDFELDILGNVSEDGEGEDAQIVKYSMMCKRAAKDCAYNGMESILTQINLALAEWKTLARK